MTQIDVLIGQRIEDHRKALRLSQTDLAQKIGVSLTQMQAYERGKVRIGASRLWYIAEALNISVVELFQEVSPATSSTPPEVEEMLSSFETLSPARKTQALMQMRALSERHPPLQPPLIAPKRPQ